MFRFLLPVAILISGAANAQTMTSCSLTDDQKNCNRVVACVGDDGLWFNGRAFGRGEGTFSGTLSDGTNCGGDWVSRNLFGVGEAHITCEDGQKGTVFYTYQDAYTGTALGQGVMLNGDAIRIWSGNNVLEYLKAQTGERIALLPCSGGDIPIS